MRPNRITSGAWSAAPTPFKQNLAIDLHSVRRMITHHIRLGLKGVFIGGTCGEGPWLPRTDLRKLTQACTETSNGKIAVAVQVTDNSYSKVLEHIKEAKADGADLAIVAEPWFAGPMSNVLEKHYMEIADRSVLPIGFYSRSAKIVSLRIIKKVLQHPNVVMFKDSSVDDEVKNLALEVRSKKPSLLLLTGYELNMTPYLEAGYDGVLAGGGVLIGSITAQMIKKSEEKDFAGVAKLQAHCDRINYTVYGGREIKTWLTGLKYALMKMGIFSTTAGYLQYPLRPAGKQKIDKMIKTQASVLFPYQS
ncbi:MAG: hypothetical protein A2Y12_09325 [Planctomycetes bacterium GWF2_42_9]|nr:MAG: hypothetical protein A2Y12_09325 [Planctomycetes bacterium GWF2_42_9]